MRRSAHWKILFLVLATIGRLDAQSVAPEPARLPAYRGRLLGVYNVDSGEPIEGAEVTDALSRTTARTTKTGTVSLVFLPDGGSLVKIQKLGFEPTTIMVAISPADTVPFTVLLKPAAQTLPTVVSKDSAPHHLSPGLQAFEERRRAGFGRFLSDAELRKNDGHTMTNVIRAMGVRVQCSTVFPYPCHAFSTRAAGLCALEVYLDGININKEDRDLERMIADQYSAVEAYMGPAEIPPLYNKTGSTCGVLILWSRER